MAFADAPGGGRHGGQQRGFGCVGVVAQALAGARTVLLVLPSQKLRENLTQWDGLIDRGATLVNLAKGIDGFDKFPVGPGTVWSTA